MKKVVEILLTAIVIALCAVGCAKEQKQFPSDEEIMKNISEYLDNAVYQDPAIFPSMNDFLEANLGLNDENVLDATLYMGAPNRNTTYFLMITKSENADTELILQRLERIMQAQVKTAEMGYISGYREYDIIEKENKIFAIMHEDQQNYSDMRTYLNSL